MKLDDIGELLGDISLFEVECTHDGILRRISYSRNGKCAAVLELAQGDDEGEYRHGAAGEHFSRGVLRPIGPGARGSSETAAPSFDRWVFDKIEAIRVVAAEDVSKHPA
jgi:hypothetical protein